MLSRIRFFAPKILFFVLVLTVSCFAQTLEEGIELFEKGDLDNAEKLLKEYLKIDSNNPDALIYLSRIYISKDKFTDAEKTLEAALKSNQNNPEIYVERAKIELYRPRTSNENKHKTAEKYYKLALAIDPSHPKAKYSLHQTYFELEKFDSALEIIDEYLEENPQHIQAYLDAAELVSHIEYNILTRCDKIESYISTALNQNNATPDELYELGWLFFICGDLETAMQVFRLGFREQETPSYRAYMDGGLIAKENLNFGEAWRYFQLGFEKMPDEILQELTNPENAPQFLTSFIAGNFGVELSDFLFPFNQPSKEEIYLRKLHHFALTWLRHRTVIKRKKPLEYSGSNSIAEPYLIHWGKHNYVEYGFYFLLSVQERGKYQLLITSEEMKSYRKKYSDKNDPTPGNSIYEIENEFEIRLNNAYDNYKIFPDKLDKNKHARDFSGYDDRGKIYLQYGKPDDSFSDSGGMKNIVQTFERRSMDLPPLLQSSAGLSSLTNIIITKPNLSWSYIEFDYNLNFDFVEIQDGYYTLVDDLSEATYGNDIGMMLLLNRAYDGMMAGVYEEYLNAYDREQFTAQNMSSFLVEYIVPDLIKRDDVIANYPTNIIDSVNPYKPLIMNLDFATFKGEDGKTRLEIYTGIEYRNLTFEEMNGNSEKADLEYWLAIADKDDNILQQGTTNHIVTIEKELKGQDRTDLMQFNIPEIPGTYELRATIFNPQGMKRAKLSTEIVLRSYDVDTLTLSDIQLAFSIVPEGQRNSFLKNGLSVVPYPFRSVKRTQQISIYFEVYNLAQRQDGSTNYEINYTASVTNENVGLFAALKSILPGRDMQSSITTVNRRSGSSTDTVEYLSFEFEDLMPGEVELKVTIHDIISGKYVGKTIVFKLY